MSMEGKVCVVTGGTSGIGLQTVLGLASLGAEVIGVGRSAERCDASAAAVRDRLPRAAVRYERAELASQGEVRDLGRRIREREGRVDVLINNAGTFVGRRKESPEGVELQLAVNCLAPFLLTAELWPALAAAPAARVVNVSSGSHLSVSLRLLERALDGARGHGGGRYRPLGTYGVTKLACILFTYELARRLGPASPVSTFAVDPGLVNTDMGLKDARPLVRFVWLVRRRRGITPAEGARTSIYLASDPEAPKRTGRYWKCCSEISSSPESRDVEAARLLWGRMEELAGLAPGGFEPGRGFARSA
jgi:retinol dehydrogenase-12